MKPRALFLIGAAAIAAAWPHASAAGTDDDPATYYELSSNSSFETGCFTPCLCPVLITSGVRGSFLLRRVGFDGLFTTYEVSDVQWTLPDVPTPVQIRGSGTYRVGGEFAVQQEFVLDLTFDANAAQHFDSGLVAGGGEFPAIDISVSLHQNTACRDTVIDVKAKPAVSTSVGGDKGGSRTSRVSVVSPFRAATDVRLSLARPERIAIDVFDSQGRLVRRLAPERLQPAGGSVVRWDGLNDRGATAAAGIYLVRVRTEEGPFVRRAVKLR